MNGPRHILFAPGAIERTESPRRRELRRLLRTGARIAVAATVAGLLAGLVTGARAEEATRPTLLPTAVGLHVGSHHFTQRHQGTWNDQNPGLYLRWGSGLVLGTLRNSERRQSVYMAHTWQTPRWHGLAGDITAGAINGYDRPVSPLLALGASLAVTPHAAVRLSLLPKAAPKGSAAVHLSIEWSL